MEPRHGPRRQIRGMVPIKMKDADATRWRSSSGRSTCLTSSGASRPSAPTARLHPKQRHDGDGVCTMRVACRCHLETHEQLETPRPISLGLHAGCCRCDGEEPGHKRCMRDWQPRRRRHVFEGRRVSFRLTTMPTTLEGQPNMLLDKTADVAPVVKTHNNAGIAKHMSAWMSLTVASSSSCHHGRWVSL